MLLSDFSLPGAVIQTEPESILVREFYKLGMQQVRTHHKLIITS